MDTQEAELLERIAATQEAILNELRLIRAEVTRPGIDTEAVFKRFLALVQSR